MFTRSHSSQVNWQLNPLNTIVQWCTGDFRGALNWAPMMPRDASLSDSCMLIAVVFGSKNISWPGKTLDLRILSHSGTEYIMTWKVTDLRILSHRETWSCIFSIKMESDCFYHFPMQLKRKLQIKWIALNTVKFCSVNQEPESYSLCAKNTQRELHFKSC